MFPVLFTLRLGGREIGAPQLWRPDRARAWRRHRPRLPRRRGARGWTAGGCWTLAFWMIVAGLVGVAPRLRARQRRATSRASASDGGARAALAWRACCPTARASCAIWQGGLVFYGGCRGRGAGRLPLRAARGLVVRRRSATCSRPPSRSATPLAGSAASPRAAASARRAAGALGDRLPARLAWRSTSCASAGAIPAGGRTRPAAPDPALRGGGRAGDLRGAARAAAARRPAARAAAARATSGSTPCSASSSRSSAATSSRGLSFALDTPRLAALAAPSARRAAVPVGRPARQPDRVRAVHGGVDTDAAGYASRHAAGASAEAGAGVSAGVSGGADGPRVHPDRTAPIGLERQRRVRRDLRRPAVRPVSSRI